MNDEKKQLSKARQALVDRVLARLDEGAIPWDNGMQGSFERPRNAITSKQYSGMNVLNLMLAFKSDPRWLTFNQAKDNGYTVKKGAKGVPIELYKTIDKRTGKDADFDAIREEIKDMTFTERQAFKKENLQTFARSYYVFNASDVHGIEPYVPKELTPTDISARNARIENVILSSQAPIFYDGNGRNYYSPASDEIHLTERSSFKSDEFFYNTALHEMAHSTGHSSRLNRSGGTFGSKAYAQEELVAEISSVLTAAEFGLNHSDRIIENSAEYVRSWAELIRNNPQALIDATFDASRATDYVCGMERQSEHAQEKTQKESTQSSTSALYNRYEALQDKYKDAVVVMRVGDFYEVMGEKARAVADELGLTLTSRDVGLPDRVPMCGFPYHVAEQYIDKILDRHSVANVENDGDEKYILSRIEAQRTPLERNAQKESLQSNVGFAQHTSRYGESARNSSSGAWVAEKDGKRVVIGTWETHDIAEQSETPLAPEHKKPLMVNFYAGPGSGKTTAALELTAALKKVGYNVEYVSEYAKELVLENRTAELDNQRNVTDEQYRRFDRIRGSADIIVTDSPILLGLVYGDGKIDDGYKRQIRSYYDSFDNFNMLITRPKDAAFQTEGRIHDEKQSIELDGKIRAMLDTQGVFYGSYKRDDIAKTVERISTTYNRLYGEQKERTQKESSASTPTAPKTPHTLKTDLDHIPEKMKALPNWVAFRTETVDGKVKKILLSPNKGAGEVQYLKWAKSDDSTTWATFDKAVAFAKKYKLDGLAFSMSGSGMTCIDLDHHLDEHGKPSELAQKFIAAADNTYIEKSVSGRGLHIFYAGNRPNGRQNRNIGLDLEVYDDRRFISMTGNYNGCDEVSALGAELDNLLKSNLPKLQQYSAPSAPLGMDDNALIDKIRSSKVGRDFDALWSGSDICGDHSVSDFKLCNMLAFFSGGDAAQVERVFRSSGLYRPQKGDAYVKRTAEKACATLTKTFTLQKQKPQGKPSGNGGRGSSGR